MSGFLGVSCRLITDISDDVEACKGLFTVFLLDSKTQQVDERALKISIAQDFFSDSEHNKRYLLSSHIHQTGLVNLFVKNLFSRLSLEQRQLLLSQVDSRVDDECFFFIRLDKPRLLDAHAVELTESGNCFHITLSIASYPKRRDVAIATVKKYLNESVGKTA